MNKWMKLTAMTLAMGITTSVAIAQTSTEKKAPKEKSEEIIIRKSGSDEKMTIVIDGDKITVNGKLIEDMKDGEVTVLRGSDMNINAPRLRALSAPGAMSINGVGSSNANRALLGVVTDKGDGGAKVIKVTEESGADKAGLQKDDVITKVGDSKIESSNDLIAALRKYKPNDKVDVTYKRNGKEQKATATLGESKTRSYTFNGDFDFPNVPMPPMVQGFFSSKPKIGMQIQDVEEGTGVQVKDVDEDSPAAKAGIKEGDIISQVNGNAIAGVDQIREQIKDIKEGDVVTMTYKRGNSTQTAEIKIPKKMKTANL